MGQEIEPQASLYPPVVNFKLLYRYCIIPAKLVKLILPLACFLEIFAFLPKDILEVLFEEISGRKRLLFQFHSPMRKLSPGRPVQINGYWTQKKHQRRLIEDLTKKLSIRNHEDWYTVNATDFRENGV